MAAPAGAGDAPKRLVLKLARTGGDQWAVSPGAAPPAASPAAASAAPEVKSEPKEEKNGRLIIRLKAPPQRKAAESDSEGEGDGARRSADGGPEAKRQRKPSAIALAAGGALSGAPRTSQREPKAPARQDDTSSHRDDEEDDEIEVSSMSHGGGGDKNRPQSTVMIPLRKAMSSLVAHLIKKDFYGIFYEPVDPEEVHDYYEVIKKPMCFKTIRKKLADDLYPSLKSLEEDVDLICTNAMTYNPAGSVYHEEARKLLAESRAKFIDYAPRTVSTLPPKKARDHGRKSAAGADGADPLARPLGPGGVPLAPGAGVAGAAGATGASPSVARLPGTPLAAAAAGASRPMSGTPSALPSASSAIAASPLAPPAGRRYAAPTMPPQRRPQPAINAGVLPAAGVAPGTSDAKATFAYNPAVPGKPATASPYASTTQNYVNAPTRPGMMRGPLPVAATTMEEQQYQASVEAFVKGTQSAEAAAQVTALLTRLKNPPPVATASALLAEVLADVRSHPHTEPPQMDDITAVVDATRDIPGVDISFLLHVLPTRSAFFAASAAASGAATGEAAPAAAGADKELQRELDRNYESLVRLQQMHHQRPAVSPATPAPAEAALSHALSLSLALLSSKLPLEALHPVSAAVPSLTHNAAAAPAAAAANGTEAKHEANVAASSGTPSPPAPQPMAMETS